MATLSPVPSGVRISDLERVFFALPDLAPGDLAAMESDVVDARKAGNDPTSDLRIDEAKQRREEILASVAAQAQNEAEAPAQTPAARAGVRLVTDVTANGAELAG